MKSLMKRKTATLLDNFGSVAKIKAPPRGRTEVAVCKGKIRRIMRQSKEGL